jgi:DNA-binding helix-hairpin-helix protein with protein kinase domain
MAMVIGVVISWYSAAWSLKAPQPEFGFHDLASRRPADARTREHIDWIAEEILDAGGTAGVWLAQPAELGQERDLAQAMADARAAEYRAVLTEAETARSFDDAERQRVLRRLRAELRRIHRRDYFPPAERRAAERAVAALHPDQPEENTA